MGVTHDRAGSIGGNVRATATRLAHSKAPPAAKNGFRIFDRKELKKETKPGNARGCSPLRKNLARQSVRHRRGKKKVQELDR